MKSFIKGAFAALLMAVVPVASYAGTCDTCVVATGNKTVDVYAASKLVFQFTPGGVIFYQPVLPNGTTNPFAGYAPLNNPVFTGTVTVPDIDPTLTASSGLALNAKSASSQYAPIIGAQLEGNPTTNDVSAEAADAQILNAESARAYYAPLNSPQLTGDPTAPTPPATNNSDLIATTNYSVPRGAVLGNSNFARNTNIIGGNNVIITGNINLSVNSSVKFDLSAAMDGQFTSPIAACDLTLNVNGTNITSMAIWYNASFSSYVPLAAGNYPYEAIISCNAGSNFGSAYSASLAYQAMPK